MLIFLKTLFFFTPDPFKQLVHIFNTKTMKVTKLDWAIMLPIIRNTTT